MGIASLLSRLTRESGVMAPDDVVDLVKLRLWAPFMAERARLDRIDLWSRVPKESVTLPRTAPAEVAALAELAKTPWLGLVVSVCAQATLVDGYRSPKAKRGDNVGGWRTWVGNDMDSRQTAIHRSTFTYGYTYATVMPGVAPDGSNMAAIRGVSPRKMQAFYADDVEDDWPMFALRIEPSASAFPGPVSVTLYDEVAVYHLTATDETGGNLTFLSYELHGAGVCPVVRYTNLLDLEGRADGEVEPFIGIAKRIDKTKFDRLLVQHFNSWKIRYATGMEKPDDTEEGQRIKALLRQSDILVGEAGVQFGTLDETQMDGFLKADEADVETLAAVSQTPTHALTGALINLSADALVAARAQLDQKLGERKPSLGKAHAQALRLAAHLEGDEAGANDIEARMTWQDTSIRSLASAADALGKLATMLGIPVEALWAMIPGVSRSDVEDWLDLKAKEPAPPTPPPAVPPTTTDVLPSDPAPVPDAA